MEELERLVREQGSRRVAVVRRDPRQERDPNVLHARRSDAAKRAWRHRRLIYGPSGRPPEGKVSDGY